MSIHEYQSQALMRERGIKVPRGQVATTPEEAYAIAKNMQQEGEGKEEPLSLSLSGQAVYMHAVFLMHTME